MYIKHLSHLSLRLKILFLQTASASEKLNVNPYGLNQETQIY